MVYFSQSCEEQPECLPCTETFKKGKGFFIMKKLTALLPSLCMVLTMACATTLAEVKTASATAEGFGGGNVTVTLSVDGDKLVNVDDLNAEQKDRLGAALTVTLLNEIYRGKAEFWVEGQ